MSGFSRQLLATARVAVARSMSALRPPPRLTLSEWADRKYRLSADAGAAEPGRWRTRPYQREIMDSMTDRRVESVTLYKSARVGYTEWLKALIGYHVEHDPCPILIVQPSEDDAKGFAKESIEPLLRDCPTVGERFRSPGRRDSMLLRRFVGGILQIAGARSPGNFRRVSRRVVLNDELDGYPPSAGKEGDPRELAEKRSESFWNRKHVRGSTPTDKGHSRIERLFYEGDQRRRYLPCPHCRGMQVLQFKNLSWKDRPPEQAVFICIHCAQAIEHSHLRWMDANGEWRPGPHPQFPGDPPPPANTRHRSYHIWSAYSYLPNATWGHIAAKFVAANAAGAEALKTFVNTWLGETWVSRGEAPEWDRLYARRELYEIGSVPMGALFLTAAVDVQPDRLIWEVVGWGRGKESWSIEVGALPGNTADLSATGPWAAVDALLDRSYRHEGGQLLRIRMVAIDSGNQTQTVYAYGRSKQESGRVIVVKGMDQTDVLVGSPTKQDVAPSGQRIGSVLLWGVGVSLAKSEFYGWLALRLPTDEERAGGARTPPGYCHFPQYGEDFFKQITGEQLVSHTDKRGFTVRVWEKVPGRENHHLDIRNYARAAAAVVGLDRSQDADWAKLEKALNVTRDTETPPEGGSAPPPPAVPRRPTAPPRRGQPWIQRDSGWLKGR